MPYRYEKLRSETHIRIVELFPGQPGSNIECKIHQFNLDDGAPDYIALSYVWGDPKITRKISLDGSVFEVTTNLHAALENLRDTTPRRLKLRLWIDAISINQTDLKERSGQVSRMKAIYESADQVAAWLGPEADDSTLAMKKIETLSEFYHDLMMGIVKVYAAQGKHNTSWRDNIPKTLDPADPRLMANDPDSKTWAAMARLFERPWWRRTWVLQEASTSVETILTCGVYSIKAECLGPTYTVITSLAKYPSCDWLRAIKVKVAGVLEGFRIKRADANGQKYSMHMLPLLQSFRGLETTDPRDKVYAPLNLATDMSSGDLATDYEATVREVYLELAACSIFQNGFNLDVLGYSSFSDDANWPSWLPDWRSSQLSTPFEKRTVSEDGRALSNLYSASGSAIAPQHHFPGDKPGLVTDKGVLIVKAIFVQRIGDVSDEPAWKADDARGWAMPSHKDGPYMITDELLSTAYLRTIVADVKNSESGAVVRGNAMNWGLEDNELKDMILHPAQYFKQSEVERAVVGRRFAVSEQGLIALVPGGSKIGDFLCVLLGGQTFYVLRCEGEKEGHFELIGECYVHGLMDGKVMDWVADGLVDVRVIGIW